MKLFVPVVSTVSFQSTQPLCVVNSTLVATVAPTRCPLWWAPLKKMYATCCLPHQYEDSLFNIHYLYSSKEYVEMRVQQVVAAKLAHAHTHTHTNKCRLAHHFFHPTFGHLKRHKTAKPQVHLAINTFQQCLMLFSSSI